MSNLDRTSRTTWLLLAVTFAVFAGCRKAPVPESVSPPTKAAPQIVNTAPVENSSSEDCGLTAYPMSRSNKEILADVPRETNRPNSAMLAKLAINQDGKVTHLRVLHLAHPNAPNWREINESALDSIRRWHWKPTLYQGKRVAVCTDGSVIVDLH